MIHSHTVKRNPSVAQVNYNPYAYGIVTRVRAKYRILVVDDDETLAGMVGQMLRRMGYLAVVCTRPLDALRFFSKTPERFDAAILDELMPELRGTQLAIQLLKIKDDFPVVLMTGHGDKITMNQVRESGVRATLIKPVLRDRLELALGKLLER